MKKGFNRLMNFLARRRQAGATGTPPKPPKCPFPNCGADVNLVPGRPPVCENHWRLMEDVRFIMNHLVVQEPTKPKGPSIIVPRGPMPGGPRKAA